MSLRTSTLILLTAMLIVGCNQATSTSAEAADTTASTTESATVPSAANSSLSTDKEKFSYALGVALSNQLKQVLDANTENIDRTIAVGALIDSVNDKDLKMSEEEIQTALNAERTRQEAEANEIAGKMAEAGTAFLAQNKTQDGWTETASGLQYKTVTEGTGPSPTADQTVKVHYAGTLIDGTQFDSSYERGEPVEFPLSGVIPGWTEGVQLMKVGGKTEFAIPSDLAYGPQGRPSIPPNSVLLFTVELLEIK